MTIQVEAVQSLDIESAIAFQRGMYRDDIRIDRLVSRQPPTSLDLNTGELQEEPGARVGMTMGGRLLRYVGHPEGYGSDFPWSKAYWHLAVECRRTHPAHRGEDRPYWRGNLCQQAVRLTVIGGDDGKGPLTAEEAASVLRVESIEALLMRCFRFIEDRLDDFRRASERRAREDAGLGPGAVPRRADQAHHVPSAEHIADCPNRECRSKRIA